MGDAINQEASRSRGCLYVLALMLATVLVTIVTTVLVINYYIFPKPFKPVTLSQGEARSLDAKLQQFGLADLALEPRKVAIEPEAYSEKGSKREVYFTEKELNALLAKNTDLASLVAIDLSEDLASAKAIIPLDADFPVLGGKTLKVSAGIELAYKNSRPVVILKGVSLWGVPMPNAWLGNLKNVDLINEFGGDEGFWKSFAEGIEHIRVEDGLLNIKLKE